MAVASKFNLGDLRVNGLIRPLCSHCPLPLNFCLEEVGRFKIIGLLSAVIFASRLKNCFSTQIFSVKHTMVNVSFIFPRILSREKRGNFQLTWYLWHTYLEIVLSHGENIQLGVGKPGFLSLFFPVVC